MTPRKPKHWLENSKIKTISWVIGTPILLIFTLYQTYGMATNSAPKTKTVDGHFINSELGLYEVKVCNESQNPINWEDDIDSYTTKLRFIDSTGKNIPIKVNYPTISTAGKPECTTLTGSIQGDFYGTGKFYTECSGKITSWCSLDWKDSGKSAYRKHFSYIIVDASAQSHDESKIGERYDSINPKILANIFGNILFTQAPGRDLFIRDGLYQNPQKRPIICGDLTTEEREFYKQKIHENFSQYINEALFCTKNELLTEQDDDLRAFLYYIGDCEVRTEKRGNICPSTGALYTRKLHENNPESVVIFFPAITEELKIK